MSGSLTSFIETAQALAPVGGQVRSSGESQALLWLEANEGVRVKANPAGRRWTPPTDGCGDYHLATFGGYMGRKWEQRMAAHVWGYLRLREMGVSEEDAVGLVEMLLVEGILVRFQTTRASSGTAQRESLQRLKDRGLVQTRSQSHLFEPTSTAYALFAGGSS